MFNRPTAGPSHPWLDSRMRTANTKLSKTIHELELNQAKALLRELVSHVEDMQTKLANSRTTRLSASAGINAIDRLLMIVVVLTVYDSQEEATAKTARDAFDLLHRADLRDPGIRASCESVLTSLHRTFSTWTFDQRH